MVPSSTSADDPPEGTVFPPGENVYHALQEGEPAPFAGVLYDTDTAIRTGNRIEKLRLMVRVLTNQNQAIADLYSESMERRLTIVTSSYEREIQGLRNDLRQQADEYTQSLAEYEDPPFYETWGFAFALGGVVVLAVEVIIGAVVLAL